MPPSVRCIRRASLPDGVQGFVVEVDGKQLLACCRRTADGLRPIVSDIYCSENGSLAAYDVRQDLEWGLTIQLMSHAIHLFIQDQDEDGISGVREPRDRAPDGGSTMMSLIDYGREEPEPEPEPEQRQLEPVAADDDIPF